MIPTIAPNSDLLSFLRNRSEGAWEAYEAIVDVIGHHEATPAWKVYKRYSDALMAVWDAKAVIAKTCSV